MRLTIITSIIVKHVTSTYRSPTSESDTALVYRSNRIIISAKEVMSSSAFVRLFVSRTAQKLIDRFSQNSVERWHVGHGRND